MQLTKHVLAGVMAGLTLALSIAGCDQTARESDKPKVLPQAETAPAPDGKTLKNAPPTAGATIMQPIGDVRQVFIAKPQPLLDKGASVSVLAASNKKLKPKALVKELDRPTALVFAQDGTLYFIGDGEDAIVAITPNMTSRVIARSGTVVGNPKTDDGTPLNNTFEKLRIMPDGSLLTLSRGEYLTHVITRPIGEKYYEGDPIEFVLPTGSKIRSGSGGEESSEILKNIKPVFSDATGRIIFYGATGKWYRFRIGEKIEEVNDLLTLPPAAYLIEANQWNMGIYDTDATIAPDGYIYAIEEGKDKQAPDRIIRIGDHGQSSLRKEASRVVIAEFKHGELTGALAFSPKGELVVGTKNAIYLITPAAGAMKWTPESRQ